MSPVQHPVAGPALLFALAEETETLRRKLGGTRDRVARTLVKEGPLRVTLVGMKDGSALEPHRAEGPISVQVLEGEVEFIAEERAWTLASGSLLALDAGITHEVRSPAGGFFLLTVAMTSGDRPGA